MRSFYMVVGLEEAVFYSVLWKTCRDMHVDSKEMGQARQTRGAERCTRSV